MALVLLSRSVAGRLCLFVRSSFGRSDGRLVGRSVRPSVRSSVAHSPSFIASFSWAFFSFLCRPCFSFHFLVWHPLIKARYSAHIGSVSGAERRGERVTHTHTILVGILLLRLLAEASLASSACSPVHCSATTSRKKGEGICDRRRRGVEGLAQPGRAVAFESFEFEVCSRRLERTAEGTFGDVHFHSPRFFVRQFRARYVLSR